MGSEARLQALIETLRQMAAQDRADADEQVRAGGYAKMSASARAESFVRVDLPAIVEELLPKVGPMANAPVATGKDAQSLNQFDGTHHDWRYAFRVGQAEGIAESCEEKVEVTVKVLDRNQAHRRALDPSEVNREGAEGFFLEVVTLGVRL